MKKIYIQPTTKVVEIRVQASLLAGSQKLEFQGIVDPPTPDGSGDPEEVGM